MRRGSSLGRRDGEEDGGALYVDPISEGGRDTDSTLSRSHPGLLH